MRTPLARVQHERRMSLHRARAASWIVAARVVAARVVAPVVLAASAAALGCGPSMRTLVESDMRFEHCYRIDDDPQAAVDEKRRCWREWTARYTKGQERSRVSYAKDRLRVLDGVPASPAAPSPTTAAVACPPPDSPYAPPPPIATPSGASQAANGAPIWPVCGQSCTDAWRACMGPCGPGSGCVVECDVRFKDCMKGCL